MADKVQYYTNYGRALGYLASGNTIDYAYGNLGALAVTFELGNSFYQDCTTFESSIFPKSMKPLTYMAKISKAPFSMTKGPDVTSLKATVNGNVLTVATTASDNAYSFANVTTTQQGVREVRVFMNTHPFTLPASDTTSGYVITNGVATIDVSLLASGSRNVVYVQATDTAGYRGPVTAAYFVK